MQPNNQIVTKHSNAGVIVPDKELVCNLTLKEQFHLLAQLEALGYKRLLSRDLPV